MINQSHSLCPMYLTYKDHKGWTGEDGSPPPTRPIAGGNTGMNIHLSEVLSEIIEPLVDAYEGGDEIISTEDFKARIETTNEGNTGWTKWRWWGDKTTVCGKYVCCMKCMTSNRGMLRPPTDQDHDSTSEEAQAQGNSREDEEYCEEETPTQGNTNADNGVCNCIEEEDLKKIENWEEFWDTEEGRDSTFWEVSDEEWKTMIEEKTSWG